MAFAGFPPAATTFLADLARHNEKAWFDANRTTFDTALIALARDLVVDLGARLPDVHAEPKVGGSIFRINRDIRFSRDKRPYKTHLDLWFWRGDGPSRGRPGFFFRLMPDALALGAGMHHLEESVLARYRQAVLDDERGAALDRALAIVQAAGYGIGGQELKRVPTGLPADHPRAELLKHTGLFTWVELAPLPPEVHGPELVDLCRQHFLAVAPVLDWVTDTVDGR